VIENYYQIQPNTMKLNSVTIIGLLAISQSAIATTISSNPLTTTLTTVYTSKSTSTDSIEISSSSEPTTIDLKDLANLEQNGDENDQEKSIISDSIVNENKSQGEYIAVTPILKDDKDLSSKNTGIERREANANANANADADAWRWHTWFRNQPIYKREANADADADANAGTWRWFARARPSIYKRDADADADAWRWHTWFKNKVFYRR
jgi:hypothetical protein